MSAAVTQALTLARLRTDYASGARRPSEVIETVLHRIAARGDDHVWIVASLTTSCARPRAGSTKDAGWPAALWRAVCGQGQYRRGRPADHGGLSRFRLYAETVGHGRCAVSKRPARSSSARPISTSSRPVWSACARPTACRAIRSTPALHPGRLELGLGRRGRSRRWSLSRSAPTPRGRVACRPASTISSALKPTGRSGQHGRGCPGVPLARLRLDLRAHRRRRIRVLDAMMRPDEADPFSRAAPQGFSLVGTVAPEFAFAVPSAPGREFFGNAEYERLFGEAVQRMEALGGRRRELGFRAFRGGGGDFLQRCRCCLSGSRRSAIFCAIIRIPCCRSPARSSSAAEMPAPPMSTGRASVSGYCAPARRAALGDTLCLMVPTAPTQYRVAEVERDPIALNGNLGTYTNFVNPMDMAAIALPSGFTADGPALWRHLDRTGLQRFRCSPLSRKNLRAPRLYRLERFSSRRQPRARRGRRRNRPRRRRPSRHGRASPPPLRPHRRARWR